MSILEVDETTHEKLVFAARVMGCTPSEVVRRLVDSWSTELPSEEALPARAADLVPVYAIYRAQRTEATFDPSTRTVTISVGPHAGTTFASPSAAAGAVIKALNPDRDSTKNGWTFWRLLPGGDELKSLRHSA